MKSFLSFTILLIALSACNPASDKQNESVESLKPEPFIGKKFFDYDAIEHYSIEIEEAEVIALYNNKSKSVLDSFKIGLIGEDLPMDIFDFASFDQLEKVGYKKSSIDTSKFDEMDRIFVEKTPKEFKRAACMPVYRDILIFKRNDKNVGTAKVCFDCDSHQIHGAAANTENFGLADEYWDLRNLLRR
ncbi:MAG: hypothetical protein ACYC1Q_10590 [Bacteroidia bacterium]